MQELNYIRCGDYYIPDIRLPEENRPIGRWGRMHREYLREHMIFCGIREKSPGEWQKKKHLPNTKNLIKLRRSPLILTRRSIGC